MRMFKVNIISDSVRLRVVYTNQIKADLNRIRSVRVAGRTAAHLSFQHASFANDGLVEPQTYS